MQELSTEMEEAPRFMGLAGQRLRFMITAVSTIGFLLFGYDQGVMSGIVRLIFPLLRFLTPKLMFYARSRAKSSTGSSPPRMATTSTTVLSRGP
jgi:hypothetical protein